MYPRNAALPERIAIGPVILIADGTPQSSGVTVTVRGQGGAEAASGGTIAFGATGVIVYYTPTQAETNFTSFVVIASKASCIPACVTVVTTASSVPGRTMPADGSITAAVIADSAIDTATFATGTTIPRVTLADMVTTYTGDTPQTGDSFARIGVAGAGLTNIDLPDQTFNLIGSITGNLSGSVGSVTAAITLPTIPANWIAAAGIATGALTSTKFASGAIDAAALATDAVQEIRDAIFTRVMVELTGDPGATPTFNDCAMLPFMGIRNKRVTNNALGTDTVHNSVGTILMTAGITYASSIFTKEKYV